MAVRYPLYTGQDGKTRMDQSYFNPIWADLDSRLDALEQLSISWSTAVDEITAFGLARIDATLAPLIVQVQTDVAAASATAAEILAEVEAIDLQAQIDDAFEAQNTAVDAALAAQTAAVDAALDAQDAAVTAALASVGGSFLGGHFLAVNPTSPIAQSSGTDTRKPYTTPLIAANYVVGGDVVFITPGTYTTGLETNKATTWRGQGLGYKSGTTGTNYSRVQFSGAAGYLELFDWGDYVFENLHFTLTAGTKQSAFRVNSAAFTGTTGMYLSARGCSFETDSATAAAVALIVKASAKLEGEFRGCYFNGASNGAFELSESGTASAGTLAFTDCVFDGAVRFLVPAQTVKLTNCQVNGAITASGTLIIDGKEVSSSTSAAITSVASATLALTLRNVALKSNAVSGNFLAKGASSTFTVTLVNAPPTGTATSIEAGITATYKSSPLADASVSYAKVQNVGANKLLGRGAATGPPEEFDLTAAGRALLDDADATAQRATLGFQSARSSRPMYEGSDGSISSPSSAINSATTAYFWRVYVPVEILVAAISVATSGTPTTPNTFDLAVYTEDGTNRLIHVTTASISGNNTTYTTAVSPAVRLTPGYYYFACVANGTVNLSFRSWQNDSGLDQPAGKYATGWTATVTAGTLPTTISPGTATDVNSIDPPVFRLDA